MKTQNNTTICPSVETFEKYLANQMSNKELVNFLKHTETCTLCSEAIDGYTETGIRDIQAHLEKPNKRFTGKKFSVISINTLLQIAASVVILISMGVSVKLLTNDFGTKNHMAISDADPIVSSKFNGLKKLYSQSTDQYLFLGEQNAVFINDQMVSSETIPADELVKPKTEKVIVQVETKNTDASVALISQIKEKHNIPVFTIRNIQ